MPTGTYVQARLQKYTGVDVMEVDIFPSEVDVDQSEGLCSKLKSGKLIKRDGTVSLHPDNFSLDWRYGMIIRIKKLSLSLKIHKTNYFPPKVMIS